MVPVHGDQLAGDQVSSEWFAEGGIYASLNKPGEVVVVTAAWRTLDGNRYASGTWIEGPRTGGSWTRIDRDDIYDAYEKVVAIQWRTANQTSTRPTPTDEETEVRPGPVRGCKCGCNPPKTKR